MSNDKNYDLNDDGIPVPKLPNNPTQKDIIITAAKGMISAYNGMKLQGKSTQQYESSYHRAIEILKAFGEKYP